MAQRSKPPAATAAVSGNHKGQTEHAENADGQATHKAAKTWHKDHQENYRHGDHRSSSISKPNRVATPCDD
jgi:hypothetical protein